MNKTLLLLIIFTLIALYSPVPSGTGTAFAAEVKNTVVKKDGNRLLFQYDLHGGAGEVADVKVILTIKGKDYHAEGLHLEGDYGKVRTGSGKRLWWNVLQDFPRGFSGKFDYEITAGAKAGDIYTDPATGMEFVFVKGGCYRMGQSDADREWLISKAGNDHYEKYYSDEKPAHEVCVDDYYIGKYEVTVGEFRKFINDTGYRTDAEKGGGCRYWTGSEVKQGSGRNWRNPGFSQRESHPAVCVSWNDARAYLKWLSRKSGKNYRLPTEAEWEYAARSGGKRERYAGFSTKGDIYRYANFCDTNCDWSWKTESQDDGYKFTAPVGSYRPNGIGLYDMSGNVHEWVADRYGEDYYKSSPKNNPKGPYGGEYRVLRGGAWDYVPRTIRSANRGRINPVNSVNGFGFRCARTP